jgi:hypothetical protein
MSATPPCSRPVGQEMRTSPCGEARIWLMPSFAACASSRSAKQWRWSVLPASVSESRRVVRLMRRTPSSVSSAAIRRLSFDDLQAQCFRRRRIGAEVDDFGEEIEVVEVLNWGHSDSLIILFKTNVRSISRSVQAIIA